MATPNTVEHISVTTLTKCARVIRWSSTRLTRSRWYWPTPASYKRLYRCVQTLAESGKCYLIEPPPTGYRWMAEFPPR